MWYMLCTNWVVFENNKCIISIGTQSWIGSLWVSFKKWQKLKSLWSLLELGLIKSRPKWTNSSGIMKLKQLLIKHWKSWYTLTLNDAGFLVS